MIVLNEIEVSGEILRLCLLRASECVLSDLALSCSLSVVLAMLSHDRDTRSAFSILM